MSPAEILFADRDPEQSGAAESGAKTGLVQANDVRPQRLYVIPLNSRPFFPAQIMPVVLDFDLWGETLERVMNTPHRMLALFFVEDFEAAGNTLSPEDVPATGTLVRVHQLKREKNTLQFVAEGLTRVQISQWLSRKAPYLIEARYPSEAEGPEDEVKAYAMAVISAIKELVPTNPLYGEELKHYLQRFSPNDPGPLADIAAAITTGKGGDLQGVLDEADLLPRLQQVLPLLKREIEVVRLHTELQEEVNDKIQKRQREFFLREQLKVIQKELGLSKDDQTSDVDTFTARLEGKTLTAEAEQRIQEELDKLKVLESGSPEYGVTRNYLDWATSLPWGLTGKDRFDIRRARRILDRDHDGLGDVKDRIIEFIAVGAYRGSINGSILLLVGPPGVGKTSIGRSVAEALNRPFYRFSVGGMRDEAEIKGHRRTYIGAMPGKFVQALKTVGTMNPVIMLDEVDKLSASFQGDPASALLETLDPEQNAEFLDHYLDLRLDLSQVMFICTANTLDSIPGPLLDRMDVIRLSGYLTEEKVDIARNHLWPRQLERAGVKKKDLRITRKALREVIEGYAREAGVRNLEKQLAKIVRKSVVQLLEEPDQSLQITPRRVTELLGNPIFKAEQQLAGIGVATGLAWTAMGGATLPVEATRIHGQNRGFRLTGKLGDVMKESAEIAYSYVCAHLPDYGIDEAFFDQAFVHLHVPEGATPKDGPSAGITMASALVSLARQQAPLERVAMTGELTLTGQVLPIGGVREKIIAARRRGIDTVIMPAANRGDYEELPDYLRAGLTAHFARHYHEVFSILYGTEPEPPAPDPAPVHH
ncbi:endopeptidase La [Natronospirillum operosum]|uniref:Lon protease n=1 Tax=Natronospirillum operosum TaxID=2759953 RepID=A0A4Z0W8P7_9GAMM|nr:endopeptidase La [Natronospirillum operosum]TGG91488.1 endopeptidase La [Natronospirillum operosum]